VDDPRVVEIRHGRDRLSFEFAHEEDLILQIMRRTGTFYEAEVLALLRAVLQHVEPERLVVDAGAFVGTHAIYLAAVCGRRVLAFEPDPQTCSLLQRNVARNALAERITCVQRALGARRGSGRLTRADPIRSMTRRVEPASDAETGTVAITPLDEALAEADLGRVGLLKVDVEGSETDVLRGARKTVAASLPVLCIEAHTVAHLWQVLGILRRQGCHYGIDDCLGHDSAPTYVLTPRTGTARGGVTTSVLWLLRAGIPRRLWPMAPVREFRSRLRRLARARSSQASGALGIRPRGVR
jgi:FkbM family methyltransferase